MSEENLLLSENTSDQDAVTKKVAVAIAPPPQVETVRLPKITEQKQKSYPKRWVIGLLGVSLVIVILLTSLAILTKSSPATGKATPTAVATKPPTVAPTPTLGLGSPAALGYSLNAFTSTFGTPAESFPDSATYAITLNGTQLRIFVALINGSDGTAHVKAVRITTQSGYLDLNNIHPIVYPFIPADAASTGDIIANGNTYHQYHSASLASSLPANIFVTTTEQPATPGSFSWFCSADQNYCYIGTIIAQQ